jgi:nucleolar protein 6
MPASYQHAARLTKKQKKATAFRERGSKLKGKGKQQPTNPAPGRSRPHTTGEDADRNDDDDEANAVPAMEDEDQALAEMAGDAEGHAKGNAKGRAAGVPKPKIAVESTAPQNKNKNSKRRRTEDGEAQPGAATRKKARLARGSKEVLPPGEEDGAASLNAVTDGDGSKANNKESKTQRYILFIGNVLPPLTPSPSGH